MTMLPKLYGELAPWYTLLTAPDDYEEEAAWYAALLRKHALRDVRRVLELGCGSGANASFMKHWFDEIVLVDISAPMLHECERLNPELERHHADMRTFRIDRHFDAVFVHDAISYLLTPEDVAAAVETAALHLEPGGVALFCPDDTLETFQAGVDDGGNDAGDGRGLRYLAWSAPGPGDHTVATDFAYLLRESDGAVRVVHDRHLTSRLPQATWLAALRSAGLEPVMIALEHSTVEADRHHTFAGTKPLGAAPP